jgi:tripartite-type tricarboxylate transporter receptor subunit TctC
MIVGAAAGGGTDLIARLIGQRLSERFGQSFIVENRPGAGGSIAAETVVNAPPDGYTLLVAGVFNAVNATLYDKLNYNFIRDIAPVAGFVRGPLILVVNSLFPAKTVSEFIAYAKANPDKINMASAGIGTGTHLAGELFKAMAGINIVHVPYRSTGPALTDLIGGQVQVMFAGPLESIEYIRTGKLRALALGTATRSDVLPDIPTLSEFLPGYEAGAWYGFGAPKNTSVQIVEKLNMEVNSTLADPKMKARLAELGNTVLLGTAVDFGKLIADETDKWGKVVKFAGIKAD